VGLFVNSKSACAEVNECAQASLFEHTIAGHTILANRPIRGVRRDRSRGTAIRFHFSGAATDDGPEFKIGESDADWYRLPHYSAARALIDHNGERVIVHEAEQKTVDRAALVRFFVPFAAALQGFVILHASAVCVEGKVIAFVGASGAGKSTIAQSLATQGFASVADDLLPIDAAKGKVSIFGSASYSCSERDLPLSAVYFMARDFQIDQAQFSQLTQQGSLLALLRHGFGEIADTAVWRTQFLGYEQIALEVPAWSLQVPDSQAALPATLHQITQEIRRHSRQLAKLARESPA
jgi:hypothetical protein